MEPEDNSQGKWHGTIFSAAARRLRTLLLLSHGAERAGTTYTQGLCQAIELAAPTAFLGKRRRRDAGSAVGSLHPPPEQGGLKVMRRSSWTMARQSLEPRGTKGSQPSTHQCMMSRDTTTCGEAQCEGVEKKAKFSLFQRCSTHSCWGPGLGGWLLPWYKSAEGCRVGPSAVILKGWKSTCEQAQSPPLTPNLPSPFGRTQGLWLLGAIPLIFSASCPSPPCV